MSRGEPIRAGDLCIVVGGYNGTASPNIGKPVTVDSFQDESAAFGRIWCCTGADLVSAEGESRTWANFAQDWLRKVEPPAGPQAEILRDREFTE
jgi:hypothetical protein